MKEMLFCFLLFIMASAANGQSSGSPELLEHSKITVLIFLSVDCPISQKYIPVLNALHDKYNAGDVKIYGIIPGEIKKANLKTFIDEYDINFKIIADKSYKWVIEHQAKTTPEVFVFNDEKTLKYHGAVDNWFYDLGKYRQETTENYLSDSIESLLAGEEPKITKTEAIGCPVQVPLHLQKKN